MDKGMIFVHVLSLLWAWSKAHQESHFLQLSYEATAEKISVINTRGDKLTMTYLEVAHVPWQKEGTHIASPSTAEQFQLLACRWFSQRWFTFACARILRSDSGPLTFNAVQIPNIQGSASVLTDQHDEQPFLKVRVGCCVLVILQYLFPVL